MTEKSLTTLLPKLNTIQTTLKLDDDDPVITSIRNQIYDIHRTEINCLPKKTNPNQQQILEQATEEDKLNIQISDVMLNILNLRKRLKNKHLSAGFI